MSKAAKLRELYPDVNLVEGNLDDAAIIETEAANADIVLRMDLLPSLIGNRIVDLG